MIFTPRNVFWMRNRAFYANQFGRTGNFFQTICTKQYLRCCSAANFQIEKSVEVYNVRLLSEVWSTKSYYWRFRTQWAALRTKFSLINDPPHIQFIFFMPAPASPNPIAAICGNSMSWANRPPTINGISTMPHLDVQWDTKRACIVGLCSKTYTFFE